MPEMSHKEFECRTNCCASSVLSYDQSLTSGYFDILILSCVYRHQSTFFLAFIVPFHLLFSILGRPFDLCYRTVVRLSVCPVTLVYCGQTVEWIKIPLGTEVCLSPGDIVLDDKWCPSSPHGNGHCSSSHTLFGPLCYVTVSATAELLL